MWFPYLAGVTTERSGLDVGRSVVCMDGMSPVCAPILGDMPSLWSAHFPTCNGCYTPGWMSPVTIGELLTHRTGFSAEMPIRPHLIHY